MYIDKFHKRKNSENITNKRQNEDLRASRKIPKSNKVIRKAYRDQLANSVPMKRCRLQNKGSLSKDIDMTLQGKTCPVKIIYRSSFENELTPNGLDNKTADDQIEFQAFEKNVKSPIEFLRMGGDFKTLTEKQSDILIEGRQIVTVAEGIHDGQKGFSYRLEEQFQQREPLTGINPTVRIYERLDAFESQEGLRATIYNRTRFEGQTKVRQEIYLNGELITEDQYYDLLQDLPNQVGLSYHDKPRP